MKLHQRLFITLFAIFPGIQHASTIYVTETGAGSMNGTSWANAYPGTSLQLAINSANTGDEVWVACGTYKPTTGTDRSIAFSLKTGMYLFGSFNGTETSLSQRSFSCGPCTILSGDINTASNTDNSYKVMRNVNLGTDAYMDGFVIRDGYDERTPTLTDGLGGGILNVGSGSGNNCSPTIVNCVITNNQAEFGGGIFNDGYNGGTASPTIINCMIVNNYATGGGGGIDNFGLSGNASPGIINCVIAYNTADDAAGAIYCWGGNGGNTSISIHNSTITDNIVASGVGGGIVLDQSNGGGGTGGNSGNVTAVIHGSIIWYNTANTSPQFHIYGNGQATAFYSDIDTFLQFSPHVLQNTSFANIISDPGFLDHLIPIGSDGCWMTDDDGYELLFTSPCVDATDSANMTQFDMAHNDRVVSFNEDMGAYENQINLAGMNESINEDILIFPNPATTFVNIRSYFSGNAYLINYLGEKIKSINLKEGENFVDLSNLNSGIYVIIHNGNSFRIIKQ